MTTISQVISALPTAPARTQSQAIFSSTVDAFVAALPPLVTQTNALTAQINTVAGEINSNAAIATAQAGVATTQAGLATSNGAAQVALATAAANTSAASANFKGAWSSLVGSLNVPASVYNNNKTWLLLNNVANVAASQPGVTADWLDITPKASAYAANITSGLLTLTVGTATSNIYTRCTIDSNRELILFQSAAAIHAVCYDNSTSTYGTVVLVRAVSANASPAAILTAANQVLVASCPDGTTAFQAVVLTLSGTAITVNTAGAATLPTALSTAGIYRAPVMVGSSYIFAYRDSGNAMAIAVTISGTTPTIGTPLVMTANSVMPSIRPIDGTRFLALYAYGTSLEAAPITVSAGTTLTKGTAATTTGSFFIYFTSLSTGRWAVVCGNNNTTGAIISVSGTVATMTIVQLSTATVSYSASIVKISDQLIVQCSTSSINVLTDVAGVATAGSAVTAVLMAQSGCIGFGADYAAFTGGQIVTINGLNPVITDFGYLVSLPANIGYKEFDDGAPNGVVSSIGGKSAYLVGGGSETLVFGPSGTSVNVGVSGAIAQISASILHQSPAVLWSAAQSIASNKIRIIRMEMI